MKKIFLTTILLLGLNSYSQDKSNKNFEAGLAYSLTEGNVVFSNPITGYLNYNLKTWDKATVAFGLRAMYFSSKLSENYSGKLAINPSIIGSYALYQDKLHSYLGLGYYYDSYTFKPTILNATFGGSLAQTTKINVSTSGFTITPGVKYFLYPNFFVDTHLNLVLSGNNSSSSVSAGNASYFNVGVGVAF